MDYNEENKQLDITPAMQPEEAGKQKKPRKRKSFGSGVILGIVIGCLILGIGGAVGMGIYANTTGNYLIISPKGVTQTSNNKVLNRKTISKIEELWRILICITMTNMTQMMCGMQSTREL